jgi:hypothetical protein
MRRINVNGVELCAALAGRYVVRYDLRGAGQSTFVDPDAPTCDLRDGWASAVSSRGCSRSTAPIRSRR